MKPGLSANFGHAAHIPASSPIWRVEDRYMVEAAASLWGTAESLSTEAGAFPQVLRLRYSRVIVILKKLQRRVNAR